MVVDYLFRVVHAAVTDLNCVAVEDFSELVVFGEMLVYQGEEFMSNVGAGVLAKRRVVTEDVVADKTTNFYKLEPSTYNDLLEKSITKSYKKAQPQTTQAIHKVNKDIATTLGIDDRVDTTADKDAFITLKDNIQEWP